MIEEQIKRYNLFELIEELKQNLINSRIGIVDQTIKKFQSNTKED